MKHDLTILIVFVLQQGSSKDETTSPNKPMKLGPLQMQNEQIVKIHGEKTNGPKPNEIQKQCFATDEIQKSDLHQVCFTRHPKLGQLFSILDNLHCFYILFLHYKYKHICNEELI